jgi:hypothetical protein
VKKVLRIRELDDPPNVNDKTLAITPLQWQIILDLPSHSEAKRQIRDSKLGLYSRSKSNVGMQLVQLCHARGHRDIVARYLYMRHHGLLTHPCFRFTWHVDRHGGPPNKPTHERRKCRWYKRITSRDAVNWCSRQRSLP